jgi:hypothetical protein
VRSSWVLAAGALIATAWVGGCGGGKKAANPADASGQVSQLASPGPSEASCPHVARVGSKVTCKVTYANGDAGRVVLSVAGRNADGQLFGSTSALRIDTIGAGAAENYLRSNILHNTGSTTQLSLINCADNVPDVAGHTFPCRVGLKDGDLYTVIVHIANTRGGLFVGKGDLHSVG